MEKSRNYRDILNDLLKANDDVNELTIMLDSSLYADEYKRIAKKLIKAFAKQDKLKKELIDNYDKYYN